LEAQKSVTRSALNIFKIGSDAYAAGAIDQLALLESRKNYQRSADETQRVKAELLRSYASLAYALGLGSLLNHTPGTQSMFAGDLRVGTGSGELLLVADTQTPASTAGQWEVELPGIFHRSALLPLWRDLLARYDGGSQGLWVRALHLDHIDGGGLVGEAWYRVFVKGFSNLQKATLYCETLLEAGQGCKVVF
jgi:hypothetical protein